jgi:deazaflavin-dependent nitroreductase family protein
MTDSTKTRTKPKGMLRRFLRSPVWIYRLGFGALLGDRFLMLTHVGRKSGQLRRTVLEVVWHDPAQQSYLVASGWGEKADWFKNIQAKPGVLIEVGKRRCEARARLLSEREALAQLRAFAAAYPARFKTIARVTLGKVYSGSPDVDVILLAGKLPWVLFEPC